MQKHSICVKQSYFDAECERCPSRQWIESVRRHEMKRLRHFQAIYFSVDTWLPIIKSSIIIENENVCVSDGKLTRYFNKAMFDVDPRNLPKWTCTTPQHVSGRCHHHIPNPMNVGTRLLIDMIGNASLERSWIIAEYFLDCDNSMTNGRSASNLPIWSVSHRCDPFHFQ